MGGGNRKRKASDLRSANEKAQSTTSRPTRAKKSKNQSEESIQDVKLVAQKAAAKKIEDQASAPPPMAMSPPPMAMSPLTECEDSSVEENLPVPSGEQPSTTPTTTESNDATGSSPSKTVNDQSLKGKAKDTLIGATTKAKPVEDFSEDNPFLNKAVDRSKKSEPPARLTFAQRLGGSNSGGGVGMETKHQQPVKAEAVDKASARVIVLPPTCAVTNENIQDDLLKESYKALVPLRSGQLRSWSHDAGTGLMKFSEWIDYCPHMSYERAFKAVTFSSAGQFVNLARCDPRILRTIDKGRGDVIHMRDNGNLTICLTPIRVTESYLTSPKLKWARERKGVEGILHTQEYEPAQLVGDVLSFLTKVRLVTSTGGGSQSSSYQSPATIRMSKPASESRIVVLEPDDEVPVYDGRTDKAFSLASADSIASFGTTLPKFDGEIPEGSLAIVAHTASIWQSKTKDCPDLNLNVHWAVVVGTPGMAASTWNGDEDRDSGNESNESDKLPTASVNVKIMMLYNIAQPPSHYFDDFNHNSEFDELRLSKPSPSEIITAATPLEGRRIWLEWKESVMAATENLRESDRTQARLWFGIDPEGRTEAHERRAYLVPVLDFFEAEPAPYLMFSDWQKRLRSVENEFARELLTFEQNGRLVNLARVDPSKIIGTAIGHGTNHVLADVHTGEFLKCAAAAIHYIRGAPHSQEFERMVAVIGMALGRTLMHHGSFGFNITFKSSFMKREHIRGEGAWGHESESWVVAKDEAVTIFDARELRPTSITEDAIKSLPIVEGDDEIPEGSFIAVCHSVTSHPSGDMPIGSVAIDLNLLWVLLVG
ncbi:hypothetical protein ONZ45_g13208 [Pleurotus djamor]|nr:hypothetical protein ONZ45_g13208 [Pleurotus djamor]